MTFLDSFLCAWPHWRPTWTPSSLWNPHRLGCHLLRSKKLKIQPLVHFLPLLDGPVHLQESPQEGGVNPGALGYLSHPKDRSQAQVSMAHFKWWSNYELDHVDYFSLVKLLSMFSACPIPRAGLSSTFAQHPLELRLFESFALTLMPP